MEALLNIGLCRSTEGFVSHGEIEAQFREWVVPVHKEKVLTFEDTTLEEDTYVAHVTIDRDTLYQIACALDQDCIAVYDLGTCEGSLVGPRAKDWGSFSPELFHIL